MPVEALPRADDHALAAADPDLACLPVLLDDDALTAFVAKFRPGVRSARARYLRYKSGTAVLAAVHIDDGEPHLAIAHGVGEDGTAKLDKLQSAATKRQEWFGLDSSILLGIAGAGADRALPGLHRALRRPGVRTLRYKPGRRWVGRRTGAPQAPLVKVYSAGASLAAAEAVRTLSTAQVPGPQLARVSLSTDTLTFTWQHGQPLDRVADADLGAVGALLSRLHALTWPHTGPPSSTGDDVLGGPGLHTVAGARPDLARAAAHADELSLRLAALTEPGPGTRFVAAHGDFSADQVLRTSSGELSLLDLDSAVTAPAETDLGSWIGEALARACSPASRAEDIADTVLAQTSPLVTGYCEAAGHDVRPCTLLASAATSLLDRASEPFRRRERQWIDAAVARVRLAAVLTDRAENSR